MVFKYHNKEVPFIQEQSLQTIPYFRPYSMVKISTPFQTKTGLGFCWGTDPVQDKGNRKSLAYVG